MSRIVKSVLSVLLLIGLLSAALACSGSASSGGNGGNVLIGKWKPVDALTGEDSAPGSMEFLKDGTLIVGSTNWGSGAPLTYRSSSYRVIDRTRIESDGVVMNYSMSDGQLVLEINGQKLHFARTSETKNTSQNGNTQRGVSNSKLVGAWRYSQEEMLDSNLYMGIYTGIWEFNADGTFKNGIASGKYSFYDENHVTLRTTDSSMVNAGSRTLYFSLSGDQLTLKDEQEGTALYLERLPQSSAGQLPSISQVPTPVVHTSVPATTSTASQPRSSTPASTSTYAAGSTLASGQIVYGQIVGGTIEPGGTQAWFFYGQAGDVITITIRSNSGPSFHPNIELFDSDMTSILRNSGGAGEVVIFKDFALKHTGSYFVRASGLSSAGNYSLSVVSSIPLPTATYSGGSTIAYGQIVTGVIGPQKSQDWAFVGQSGDVITITIQTSPGSSIYPNIELFDSSGTSLARLSTPNLGSQTVTFKDFPLTRSGVYVIRATVVNSTGGYSLSLEKK